MKFWQMVFMIILIAVIGVGVAVWQPWKTTSKTIAVTGEGKVKDTPDVAKISGGIESRKPTAAEAQTEVSTKMAKVIEAVKAAGIADKDIKTTQVSSYPNYVYDNGKNSVNGYVANTTVEVTIREITKGQGILDLLTANSITNISGPNLTFSDEKMADLKSKAREAAVINAKKQADELAKASNTRVGKVVSITEGTVSGGTPMPYLVRDSISSAEKPTSSTIQPGEDEITLHVSVTYGLK